MYIVSILPDFFSGNFSGRQAYWPSLGLGQHFCPCGFSGGFWNFQTFLTVATRSFPAVSIRPSNASPGFRLRNRALIKKEGKYREENKCVASVVKIRVLRIDLLVLPDYSYLARYNGFSASIRLSSRDTPFTITKSAVMLKFFFGNSIFSSFACLESTFLCSKLRCSIFV